MDREFMGVIALLEEGRRACLSYKKLRGPDMKPSLLDSAMGFGLSNKKINQLEMYPVEDSITPEILQMKADLGRETTGDSLDFLVLRGDGRYYFVPRCQSVAETVFCGVRTFEERAAHVVRILKQLRTREETIATLTTASVCFGFAAAATLGLCSPDEAYDYLKFVLINDRFTYWMVVNCLSERWPYYAKVEASVIHRARLHLIPVTTQLCATLEGPDVLTACEPTSVASSRSASLASLLDYDEAAGDPIGGRTSSVSSDVEVYNRSRNSDMPDSCDDLGAIYNPAALGDHQRLSSKSSAEQRLYSKSSRSEQHLYSKSSRSEQRLYSKSSRSEQRLYSKSSRSEQRLYSKSSRSELSQGRSFASLSWDDEFANIYQESTDQSFDDILFGAAESTSLIVASGSSITVASTQDSSATVCTPAAADNKCAFGAYCDGDSCAGKLSTTPNHG